MACTPPAPSMGWSTGDMNFLGQADDLHNWKEHAVWAKHLHIWLWDGASQGEHKNSVTE